MRYLRKLVPVTLVLLAGSALTPALAQEPDVQSRGEYLARAADCTACHTAEGGEAFAGGYPFEMPMGTIISSNITPSKAHGIGDWSFDDFNNAMRHGVSADGRRLYPAMPYTAYAKLTLEDMQALYAYFMQEVAPVDSTPAETELTFPFNLPGLMLVWDTLFANEEIFTPDAALSEQENRGKYLSDALAHCSSCHTPRNAFMAEDDARYFAGATIEGWRAPNITSDDISGVGGWSQQELVSYLQNGYAENKAQAGGPMADAVQHSFRFLQESDIQAIAAYLKTVPAIREPGQVTPAYAVTEAQPTPWTAYESAPAVSDSEAYTDTSTTDGAVLYNLACAACHGINGQGSEDEANPSLLQNTAVGSSDPTNLLMAMVNGIQREGADGKSVMPAFADSTQMIHSELNNAQLAAVANYVTQTFGKGDAGLSTDEIALIRAGGESPWLIKHAAPLAIAGLLAGALIIVLLMVWLIRRRRHA